EQGDTDQRKASQIERFDRFLRGQGLQSVFARLARQMIQFGDGDRDREGGMDDLPEVSILDDERGPQYLVPLDDVVESILQRCYIKCALDSISHRHVVSRIARS